MRSSDSFTERISWGEAQSLSLQSRDEDRQANGIQKSKASRCHRLLDRGSKGEKQGLRADNMYHKYKPLCCTKRTYETGRGSAFFATVMVG